MQIAPARQTIAPFGPPYAQPENRKTKLILSTQART